MMNRLYLLGNILLFFCVVRVHGYTGADLPKGPFCGINNKCCKNRTDECSHSIRDTLCYCDEFCLLHGKDDCCPDYASVCLKPTTRLLRCRYEGQTYNLFEELINNCNYCKCKIVNNVPTMECTKKACLINVNQIDTINYDWNRGESTWAAQSYPDFWAQPLDNGKFWLGTAKPRNLLRYLDYLIPPLGGTSLPTNFTIKTRENGISIANQGPCQSSFEQSLLDVLKDRDYIGHRHSSANNVHFPDIKQHCKTEKAEKNLGEAWKSLWQSGKICRPFHLTTPVNIKHEIRNNGPVQATMKVFQDFFVYKQGIYQHKIVPREQPLGWHSVRVLGWGEEVINGRKYEYWVAANSWGEQWGERGLFRILIDGNECEFEWHVVAN